MSLQKMKRIDHGDGGGIEVLRVVEDEVPTPSPGQVLIEVRYAGVNRPDVLQRTGSYPPPAGASPYLGLEVSGRVVAIGEGVAQWSCGDLVCALVPGGGYAEYCVAEAAHCFPIPAGMSLLHAAGLPETYMTVWANLFDPRRLQAGSTLLVHGGSSGIGLTAIQLAKAFGARVFTTVGTQEKAEACTALGADVAINYRNEDFAAVIANRTEGMGVDLILDMVGASYIERNLKCLSVEGTLVLIAFLEGSRLCFDAMPIMLRRLTLTGSTLRARSREQKARIVDGLRREVWPMLEAGQCQPQICKTFPMAEVQGAHALMESNRHIGKIILSIQE